MDFELQTICVVRPVYFTMAVLLLLASAVASGISVIIAMMRRIRGAKVVSRHLATFHVAVVLVWVIYAGVVGVAWLGDQRVLREYEQTTGRVAPAVRAAMSREARTTAMLGAGCAVVGLMSMLAWRGMTRRVSHEPVA